MSVDLIFTRRWGPVPGGIDLTFGDAIKQPGARVPLTRAIGISHVAGSQVHAGYETQWGRAQQIAIEVIAPSHTTVSLPRVVPVRWGLSAGLSASIVTPWDIAQGVSAAITVLLEDTTRLHSGVLSKWGSMMRRNSTVVAPWQGASRAVGDVTAPWGVPVFNRREYGGTWQQGAAVCRRVLAMWQAAGRPMLVWPVPVAPVPPVPEAPPVYGGPGGDLWLNFTRPWAAIPGYYIPLNFGTSTKYVPTSGVYIIVNSAYITRVSDSADIPCWGIDLDYDQDSWAWGFRAVIPDRITLDMINPAVNGGPVDIDITVNGYTWRVMVEEFDESRQFGSQGYIVSGRSRTALLADPYDLQTTHTELTQRTAAQLAGDVLNLSGFAITWSAQDWLVPGGVWSYHDKTRIEALAAIAQSIDAVIVPSMSIDAVTVSARYNHAPWLWSTINPDHSLTAGIITTLGNRWQPKPTYNGVWVSGVQSGILAHIRLTGTAGDVLAGMVTDALITHQDAARARGQSIIYGSGKQSVATLQLPLAAAPGEPQLIHPGKLIEVPDGFETWRGMSTGVKISASWQQGRGLVVYQTITVERHY